MTGNLKPPLHAQRPRTLDEMVSRMAAREAMLTLDRLRELLDYNPETGVFVWKVRRTSAVLAGMVAGSLNHGGYRLLIIDNTKQYAHRVAWFYVHGEWPVAFIDHINGVADDNRICNLRDVPNNVNQQNKRKARSDSTTGLIGVKPVSKGDGFEARIQLGKTRWHLGTFRTAEQAHEAYIEAKRKIHEGCAI